MHTWILICPGQTALGCLLVQQCIRFGLILTSHDVKIILYNIIISADTAKHMGWQCHTNREIPGIFAGQAHIFSVRFCLSDSFLPITVANALDCKCLSFFSFCDRPANCSYRDLFHCFVLYSCCRFCLTCTTGKHRHGQTYPHPFHHISC